MLVLLPAQLPWFVAGPLVGLLVVATYALINLPLGVSGTYRELVTFVRDRRAATIWRVWYFAGLAGGALLATWLRGDIRVSLDYGALGRAVPPAVLPLVLFGAGVLMGYGARWAGGCTSGHGLCGTSVRSPGSLVATISFMAAAVGVTLLLHWLTGGALMKRVGFSIGLAFGFLIAASRLNDYTVLHNGLLLRDPYVFLMMGAAVGTALPLLWLLERRRVRTALGGPLELKRYTVARKDVLGGVVFGAGWAITGSCPGPALAMTVGGHLSGLFVMACLFSGLLLREAYLARWAARPLAHLASRS